ncbi:MAG: hypothetical protein JW939_03735, partial [Candidatus Thermoplasmatota archaeon]|nr:hypothetical protein [Candidatus Thermoplasmatota archaeon]
DVYRMDLGWDPPSEPGNGFPIEYEVVLIERNGSQQVIAGFEGQTGTNCLFEEIEPPYEKKLFITARSVSGISPPSDPVTIEEKEPPTFKDDLTTDSITEDTEVQFMVLVEDNWLLSEVQLEYWYDNGTFFRTVMEPDTPSVYRHTLFTKLAWGPVYYRFQAMDIFGNTNMTEDRQVDVFDLVPPIINDMTGKEAEYGDNITFIGSIEENSALQRIALSVNCSSFDLTVDIPFWEGYDWKYDIEPPRDVWALNYIIKAVDIFGLEREVKGEVSIVDTTPPKMLEDLSDDQVRYNSDFNISVGFQDLSGIGSASLFYRTGGTGSWNEFTEHNTGNISFTVALPWDEMDPSMWGERMSVTYHFAVIDPWGNTLRTENVTRTIHDPVHIGSIELLHPPHGFTGDDLFFIVHLDNKTVVDGIDIAIWIDDSYKMREPMESTDEFPDHFFFHVTLPEDSLATIFYEIILKMERVGEAVFGPFNITLYDGISPTVPSIQDRTIGPGEQVTVVVNAHDNIGIVRYEWEGAPVEVSGNTLSWVADREGVFLIRVRAYDEAGNTGSSTFTLTVEGEDDLMGPSPPDEDAGFDRSSVICVSIFLIVVVMIAALYNVKKRRGPKKPASQGPNVSEPPLIPYPAMDLQDDPGAGTTDNSDGGTRILSDEVEREETESGPSRSEIPMSPRMVAPPPDLQDEYGGIPGKG